MALLVLTKSVIAFNLVKKEVMKYVNKTLQFVKWES